MPRAPLIDPLREPPEEELANALTHVFGVALALVGAAIACQGAAETGSVLRLSAVAIFSTAQVMMFTASAGFHFAQHPDTRQRWRLLDHMSIYTLIAATYTAVALVVIEGALSWIISMAAWAMAAIGIGIKIVLVPRYKQFARVDTFIYLALGWAAVLVIGPAWRSMSAEGLILLVIGGVCYTVGAVFFMWNTLRFNHAIWHGFILVGSASHYFMVLLHAITPLDGEA